MVVGAARADTDALGQAELGCAGAACPQAGWAAAEAGSPNTRSKPQLKAKV